MAKTTINAQRVLTAIGKPEIPVYPGAKKPFSRLAVHAPDIHGNGLQHRRRSLHSKLTSLSKGTSGLDGTDLLPEPSRPAVTDKNPILAMRDALLAQPAGTAWVVATGALTNVALLFATFPEVAEHIAGLSIMGGAIGGGFTNAPVSRLPGAESRIGNTTVWAEFNIYVSGSCAVIATTSLLKFHLQCDPEAAQSILTNPILMPKTTLCPLDLTHQVLATGPVRQRVLMSSVSGGTSTALRRMLHDLLMFFAGTYMTVFGIESGPPLHDPLAVAVILSNLNPAYAEAHPSSVIKFDDRNGERFAVTVVTDGQHGKDVSITGQLGRTVAEPKVGQGTVIPRGLDTDAFWDMLLECIDRAERCRAAQVS